jgi:NCS1 family nucleobase:cation symporter-1
VLVGLDSQASSSVLASSTTTMASNGYVSGAEKASPVASSPEPYEVGQTYTSPKRRFHFSLAVDQEPSSFARTAAASNADFDPVPPSKRTWGSAAFFAYWMADGWAVSNWQVGESLFVARRSSYARAVTNLFYSASSMIASGLNWRLAIGALVLGNSIMGAVITINGRIGAKVSTGRC